MRKTEGARKITGGRTREPRRKSETNELAEQLAVECGWDSRYQKETWIKHHFYAMAKLQIELRKGMLSPDAARALVVDCLPTAPDEAITDHAILCRTNMPSMLRWAVKEELLKAGQIAQRVVKGEYLYYRIP